MLNYGFLGSILGHELTHGFDNTGRKFDYEGNENMWWTNHTIEEYEKRSDCFVHHYESYLVPDIEEKVFFKLFYHMAAKLKLVNKLFSSTVFIK